MKKRFLVTSILMLLLTVFALSTSTYAWFSMNTEVTATGMTVKAKANGAFLQIKNADGNATDSTGVTANAKVSSSEVYPAKYNGLDDGSDAWQYGYSDSYTDGTLGTQGYKTVAAGDVAKYRLANTFTIYTKDAGTTVKDLVVKSYKITGTSAFIDAIGIVVVCDGIVQNIASKDVTTEADNTVTSPTTLAATVDHTGVEVSIYVYIDGDNALITSQNAAVAANISNIDVELVFDSTFTE